MGTHSSWNVIYLFVVFTLLNLHICLPKELQHEERKKRNSTVDYQEALLQFFQCDKARITAPTGTEMYLKGQVFVQIYERLYENEFGETTKFKLKGGDKIRVEDSLNGFEKVIASESILERQLVYTETSMTVRYSDVNEFLIDLFNYEGIACQMVKDSWIETIPATPVETDVNFDKDSCDIETIHREEVVFRLPGEIYFAATRVTENTEPNVKCHTESLSGEIKCYALCNIKEGDQINFSIPTFSSSRKNKWPNMKYYRDFSLPELEHAHPIVSLTGWVYSEVLSLTDIDDMYGCDHVLDKERPFYDEATWIELRRQYHGYPDDFDSPVLHTKSFTVPYELRQDAITGRGIYATNKIKKGDLVYTTTPHAAKFRSRNDWLRFLATTRQDMVCDILMWSYCQDFHDYEGSEEDPDFTIVFTLDDGNMCNQADEYEDANVGCNSIHEEYPKLCQENFFALRDIEPGEELLINYYDFSDLNIWNSEFNL